jgi:hypothetical protein
MPTNGSAIPAEKNGVGSVDHNGGTFHVLFFNQFDIIFHAHVPTLTPNQRTDGQAPVNHIQDDTQQRTAHCWQVMPSIIYWRCQTTWRDLHS